MREETTKITERILEFLRGVKRGSDTTRVVNAFTSPRRSFAATFRAAQQEASSIGERKLFTEKLGKAADYPDLTHNWSRASSELAVEVKRKLFDLYVDNLISNLERFLKSKGH
jgi:hypothetical protein